ncbi:hypothetical protein LCGC14_0943320 [marine sediment metagenome]|uniref:Uncharacterized protein n=1 Tax=marine sediment metagenome TaxID=412755 RepID=A0A0F9RQR7_9ZZZZ
MRPLNPDGTEWTQDTANIAMREIKAQCKADLHRVEEARSEGALSAATNYSPVVETMRDDNDPRLGSVRVVDPVLAAMKFPGQDMEALLKSRWSEFCAERREETPYRVKHLQERREALAERHQADGKALEERIGGLTPRQSAPEPSAERITSGQMPLPPVAQAETVAGASMATVVVEASPVKKRAWKRGDRGRPPKV